MKLWWKSYTSYLNDILKKEGISEDQFWEAESPYIEKILYALVYAEKLYNDYAEEYGTGVDSKYECYVEKQIEALKVKY